MDDLSPLIRPILERRGVPALAWAVVRGERTVALGALGARRAGSSVPVTDKDRFHIGSCTKSMTATLIAVLAEEGRLGFETTVGEVFKDLRGGVHADWRGVTVAQLLTHRAGAPENPPLDLLQRLGRQETKLPAQRMQIVERLLAQPPESKPGTTSRYSNAGYVLAGAMAERVTGRAWESLLREKLWKPLGITTAGFGAPGRAGAMPDQPRGHGEDGKPLEPGPGADNPLATGPAGTVHLSMADWARSAAFHLQGARGKGRLLKPESFRRLHAPAEGTDPPYAMGWLVGEAPGLVKGPVLNHAGSNTLWYATVFIAPAEDLAVLVAVNQGGAAAEGACGEAEKTIIRHFQARRSPAGGSREPKAR